MPKFTVIIPTFNRAEVIARAVGSVLNQSFVDFELIVVDDGSIDSTRSQIEQINDERLSYFYVENSGVSAARNFGMSKAQGEWFAFLDSDDEWLEHKLQSQVDVMTRSPDIKIIHGEEIWIRNGKRVNQMKKHQKFGGWIFEKCLPLCLISPSAVTIHRSVIEDVGKFREDFEVCEDYELWLRITSKYPVEFISEPVIKKYGGHADQLSRKYVAMDFWRVKAIDELFADFAPKQKKHARKELLIKAEILRKGYEKHGHLDKADEMKRYIQKYEE